MHICASQGEGGPGWRNGIDLIIPILGSILKVVFCVGIGS